MDEKDLSSDAAFRIDDGSRRHHFIAEYYTKGFTNAEGLVHVYDKHKKEFLKPKSPKQIFYEDEGNTAYWGPVRNTIAEQTYSHLDKETAERVAVLRTKAREALTEQDTSFMMYHMALQYLRCPTNLGMYRNLYENIASWAPELYELFPMLKLFPKDETLIKSSRSFIPGYIVNRAAHETPGPYPFSVLEHFTEDFLVLSDNPVVFAPPPVKTVDLFTNNMLAVSSRRLVVSGDLKKLGTGILQMESYNVAAVAQAERLVCASNKKAIENAVEAWKWMSGAAPTVEGAPVGPGVFGSDAGGYWNGLATTMNQVYNHITAVPGWHDEGAIQEATGIDPLRIKAALDTLCKSGRVVKEGEHKGARYRVA